MQTTALVENTAIDGRLGSEHGLSLYVQTGERRLLFDMGQTGLFLRLLRLWQRHRRDVQRPAAFYAVPFSHQGPGILRQLL